MSRAGERQALQWLAAIREPQQALRWSLAQWESRIRLARRLRLLGRLAESLEAAGLTQQLPPAVVPHLLDARRLSRWRTQALRWTLLRVSADLAGAGSPRVLLKGAAYVAQGLPNAAGRVPSDLDILVPVAHLGAVQRHLVQAGWEETPLDEHDQRYYREWSHEVPPMRHPMVELELDLHHNLHPPVSRVKVDPALLWQRTVPVADPAWAGWHVLHPQDQLLHCASHLFEDSEFRNRLRDLVDFDALARSFGGAQGFWETLPERAQALGLVQDLALAIDLCCDWFDTPVPGPVRQAVLVSARGLRHRGTRALMARVLHPGLAERPEANPPAVAEALLLVRHHLRRMPLRLLLPHLWHKWRKARQAAATSEG